VATVAQGRIPALAPFWESTTVPGVFFAGNAMQGAAGLRKHGVGSASGTVSGFRYNARILARHLASRVGVSVDYERPDPASRVDYVLDELTRAPELWTQKAYLARCLFPDGTTSILPLTYFLDHCARGSMAATVEMNAAGDIYPTLYVRHGEEIEEHLLDPHPLHDYTGEDYRRHVEALL
jgi:hypothetical protein